MKYSRKHKGHNFVSKGRVKELVIRNEEEEGGGKEEGEEEEEEER